ncbi:MAG: DUF6036 family nucleotidyltransferase [Chloroflexia bacterium]
MYLDILQTLERLEIPYIVIGAFAGMSYGMTRLTADVDIVVAMDEQHIEALAAAYPPPRFYADPHQMQESIRKGVMFNIIDATAGRKVDLIPTTMKPGYDFALKRRIRRPIQIGNRTFEAWFARPEDVIVGKLMAWKEGRSFKHEQDIRDILVAVRLNEEPEWTSRFDFGYIDRWAAQLGPEVMDLWNRLKALSRQGNCLRP